MTQVGDLERGLRTRQRQGKPMRLRFFTKRSQSMAQAGDLERGLRARRRQGKPIRLRFFTKRNQSMTQAGNLERGLRTRRRRGKPMRLRFFTKRNQSMQVGDLERGLRASIGLCRADFHVVNKNTSPLRGILSFPRFWLFRISEL